jgi:hypothetical protein
MSLIIDNYNINIIAVSVILIILALAMNSLCMLINILIRFAVSIYIALSINRTSDFINKLDESTISMTFSDIQGMRSKGLLHRAIAINCLYNLNKGIKEYKMNGE